MPGPSRPSLPPGPVALSLNLPCALEQVRSIATLVRRFLLEQGCAQGDVTDVELALVEACNNAIQNAPASAAQRPILVEVDCSSTRIELRITDHTAGFDWPAKVSLPDSEAESGRGLFLITSVMDEVCYRRGSGINTLSMSRKRGPGPDLSKVSTRGNLPKQFPG